VCNIAKWFPLSKPNQECIHCTAKKRNDELQIWRKSTNHRIDCRCSTCKPKDQWGIKNPGWKGKSRKPTADGYMMVLLQPDDEHINMAAYADRTVLEHRLVMAKHIGRPLHKGESVHHRNGNRLDNRIENLELWVGNHGNGIRVEDVLNEYAERFGYIKK
jgi:hypothetical protein